MASEQAIIYLDNHATTRTDPRVVEAMLPMFDQHYANPGSITHRMGNDVADIVYASRSNIARFIGANPAEIIFTSGATESNNLAIFGVCPGDKAKGHIIVVASEHKAVLGPAMRLENSGYKVTRLGIHPNGHKLAGQISLDELESALREDTRLVSVMLANSEVGVLQPVAEICKICRERNIPVHTDATQAVGKIHVDVIALGVDLLSFSSHKLYGPKGIGVLYARQAESTTNLQPRMIGGGQENGRRSGTLNVPAIVGLDKALEICGEEMIDETIRLRKLRNKLYSLLCDALGPLPINGPSFQEEKEAQNRLAANLNVQFPDINAAALMMSTPGIAVSGGSACTSGDSEPSHVLAALGLNEHEIEGSIRFGLGRFTTENDIEEAVSQLSKSVQRLKNLGSRTS